VPDSAPFTSSTPPNGAPATLLREFTLSSAFSLTFAFISPIVALYSIFAFGLTSAGPGFWFGFPVVLAAQMLVALVFGMLASRYPIEGSVYQWSRQLVGERYAWFAGWTYAWTLPIAMAAVAFGGAQFLAELFGFDPHSMTLSLGLALGLIAVATWSNTHGRHLLKAIVGLCILAEVVGSIGVGVVLLSFHRLHPLSILFASPDFMGGGRGGANFFHSKFAVSIALAGWAFLGFESAGSIAEEVRDPERVIPRAMLLSLVSVATVVAFAALALILATPEVLKVSVNSDPVAATLSSAFGPDAARATLAVFVIGFLACIVSMQASVSRVMWAFARDDALPASNWLKRLSGTDRLPVNAILLAGGCAVAMYLISFTKLYDTLVAFTTVGFYISFGFPVFGAVFCVFTGRWRAGPFDLGRWTKPIILAAAVWIAFETLNIAWPRNNDAAWYERWAVPLMVVTIATVGLLVRARLRSGSSKPTDPLRL
jgi:amino acid transporter